jgi:hypothetical protein
MRYTIKAHPTKYNGVQYRSRLEARWAAFFDLVEWKHEYEPIDLPGWSPDFRVEIPCGHSECEKKEGKRDGCHVLLAEVKPYYSLKEFEGHPCLDYPYGRDSRNVPSSNLGAWMQKKEGKIKSELIKEYWRKHDELIEKFAIEIPADASAAFGINPSVSYWEMSHGAGGGCEQIENWEYDWEPYWKEAGNIVQWIPSNRLGGPRR